MTELVEVALFTDNVAAARAFYRDLVGADPVAEWPGGAIFAVGGSKILVHERTAVTTDGHPTRTTWGLPSISSTRRARRCG